MAIYATRPSRVTDEMFIEAAHALADQVTAAELEQVLLFPPQSNILETEIKVATHVARWSSRRAWQAGVPQPRVTRRAETLPWS
jgi:malic enzyme